MSTINFCAPVKDNNQLETQRPRLSPMLPNDLSLEILRLLPLQDLDTVSLVCKEWNKLATSLWNTFDLKKLFSKLSVIDKDVWEKHIDLAKYGLSFKGEEFINRRKVIRGLDRMFTSLRLEEGTGITLMSIPERLTFDILRSTHDTNGFISNDFPQSSRNDSVKNTYQIAITDCILKDSGGLSPDDQEGLVRKFKCEMPDVLEASTLATLTSIDPTAKSSLLKTNKGWKNYTRCSKIKDWFFVVGHFGFGKNLLLNVIENNLPYKYYGVAALRRFSQH